MKSRRSAFNPQRLAFSLRSGAHRSNQAGSALFVTLVIAAVIALTLAAYLSWAATQNKLASRSQSWNGALPVAEAGLEEALTQLHYTGTTNLSTNGWTATNGWYFKKNFTDAKAYYEVNIKAANPPVIISTGYTPAPMSATSYLKRRVRITTAGGSSVGAAVVSKGPIYMSGNGVTVDSFDSSNPLYSTGGMYDAAKAKDNGNVISLGPDQGTAKKPIYAMDVGDGDIKGHVTVQPGATINLTGGGTVGDNAWVNAGTSGIKPGWSSYSGSTIGVDDVPQPFAAGVPPLGPVTIGSNTYAYVISAPGNYQLDTLSGKVLITANASLLVNTSVTIGSGDFIEIAPGGSLKLYVAAASATIGGQGVVNDTGVANNFKYFGLPSNTSLTYQGNGTFFGTVYAPEATLKLGGGGSTPFDFVGSVVVNLFTINGHFHIHYDEAAQAPSSPLVVASWNEVDPNGALQ